MADFDTTHGNGRVERQNNTGIHYNAQGRQFKYVCIVIPPAVTDLSVYEPSCVVLGPLKENGDGLFLIYVLRCPTFGWTYLDVGSVNCSNAVWKPELTESFHYLWGKKKNEMVDALIPLLCSMHQSFPLSSGHSFYLQCLT